jgi:hypothetical protein
MAQYFSLEFTLDNHEDKAIDHRVGERELGLSLHVIEVSDLTSNNLTTSQLSRPCFLPYLIRASLNLLFHIFLKLR